ncbi:MAG TPA: hypothetical protein VN282_09610 [Pyrinomonadaceae bacterium]|nr:hypothetical protein [Pyrinomonadaceae bacterium]
MNDKLKPAIIGGVILGILSAIPAVNSCCCIWALVGGLVAANFYIKASPNPVTPADGAIVGAIAGVVGSVLIIVVGIPLTLIFGAAMSSMMSGYIQSVDPNQAAQFQEAMAAGTGIGRAILNALIYSVCAVIFSAVGGLLGVAIFEKRKGGPGVPPPPPPAAGGPGTYGTPGGGGYGQPGGGYGNPQ